MSPFTFSALRCVIATIVFLPFFLRQKNILLTKKDILPLVLVSLSCTADTLFFSIGILYTSAIASQILYAMVPLIVGVLSYLFLHERFPWYKILGFAIAVAGLALIFEQSFALHSLISLGTPLGNGIIMAAVLGWSLYLIFCKKIIQAYSVLTLTFASCIGSAVFFSLCIPFELHIAHQALHLTPQGIVAVITTAVSSVLMYIFYQIGLKETTAFTASLVQYLGPIFTTLTAIPLLGEQLTIGLVIGGILILVGIFYGTTYPTIKGCVKK